MRFLIVAFIGLVVLFLVTSGIVNERPVTATSVEFRSSNSSKAPEPQPLPLVAILADPARYDGKLVGVEGYLSLEFENTALFFDRQAYRTFTTRNAVWVEPPMPIARAEMKRLSKLNVSMIAVVDAGHFGRFGAYAATLRDVRFITPRSGIEQYERFLVRSQHIGIADAVRTLSIYLGLLVFLLIPIVALLPDKRP